MWRDGGVGQSFQLYSEGMRSAKGKWWGTALPRVLFTAVQWYRPWDPPLWGVPRGVPEYSQSNALRLGYSPFAFPMRFGSRAAASLCCCCGGARCRQWGSLCVEICIRMCIRKNAEGAPRRFCTYMSNAYSCRWYEARNAGEHTDQPRRLA